MPLLFFLAIAIRVNSYHDLIIQDPPVSMITELILHLQFLILVADKGKLSLSWGILIDMILIVIYRHWVLEAAVAWKGYGTHVTGYDMVDISRNLLPWATEQGVRDNIRFVRGNL